MNNQQENRLSMYLTFRDFQVSYTAITDILPNYSTNSATFVDTILQIQNIAEQQKMSKKGVTENKKQLKETLIVMSGDYARKLTAFAKFTKNTLLEQEVKFSESKLRQVADTAVKDYAQIAYDCSQPILLELKPYGIDADSQTLLLSSINSYNDSIGKPGVSRTEGSQTTRQLESLFKTADTALDNMDVAVEIVRLSQPAFYNSYKDARKIIERGIGSLAVKGFVTEASTGEPIKGVNLYFVLDGNGDSKSAAKESNAIMKKTATKGGYNIKSLPSGMYNVTVHKTGYVDQVVQIAVADGDLTELNISLSKN